MPKLDDNRKIIILNYINEYYEQHTRTPAVRDISAGTGIPVTSVQRYLVALKGSGALDYNGRRSIPLWCTGRHYPRIGYTTVHNNHLQHHLDTRQY